MLKVVPSKWRDDRKCTRKHTINVSSVGIFFVLQNPEKLVCAGGANMEVCSGVIGRILSCAIILSGKQEAKNEESGMEAS